MSSSFSGSFLFDAPQAVEILLTFPVPTPSAQHRAQEESSGGSEAEHLAQPG
jgi:hypothetical protein